MSNWTLRFAVASSVASLAMSGVTLGIVLRRQPVRPATSSASPANATQAPRAVEGSTLRTFVTRDPATQKDDYLTLPDETGRLGDFIVQAHLSRAQELELRARFAAHIKAEYAAAEQMARDGKWDLSRLKQMKEKFWGDAIEALPPAQTEDVDPSFFPSPLSAARHD